MPLRLATLAGALVAALVAATSANAAEYCVHKLGTCPPGSIDSGSNLHTALAQAAATPAGDVIRIHTGSFQGPFAYTSASPVEITGIGAKATRLTASGALPGPQDVLTARNAKVSRLSVRVPASMSWTGIRLETGSSADSVVVTADPAASDAHGINLAHDATLSRSTVTLDPAGDVAVVAAGASDQTITDVKLTANIGLHAYPGSGATATLASSEIDAVMPVFAAQGRLRIENSVLRQLGSGQASPISASCPYGPEATTSVEADHVTVLPSPAAFALQAGCFDAGKSASIALTNSIARGDGAAYLRHGSNNGAAKVTIAYSDVHLPGSLSSGPGAVTIADADVIDADPQLDASLHPQFGSPVIDTGAPGAALQTTDLAGLPRLLGARQDMGAFEFDPATAPPAPDAPPGTAEPATADGPATPITPTTSTTAAAEPTAADLLAELKRTLAGRRGRVYRHRFLVPGTLRIQWRIRSRVVAKATLKRSTTGLGAVRVKGGRRALRRRRVVARATFLVPGRAPLSATRRVKVGR